MPKNMGKGGKNRKRGTNKNESQKRELVLKGPGQEYGQVSKMLGNARLEIQCPDGTKRIGVICGRMRRKVWMTVGDIVLVSLRDFEDGKVDIIGKYNRDEAKELLKLGALGSGTKLREDEGHDDHGGVVFGEDSGDESDEETYIRPPPQPKPVVVVEAQAEEESDEDKVDIDKI